LTAQFANQRVEPPVDAHQAPELHHLVALSIQTSHKPKFVWGNELQR